AASCCAMASAAFTAFRAAVIAPTEGPPVVLSVTACMARSWIIGGSSGGDQRPKFVNDVAGPSELSAVPGPVASRHINHDATSGDALVGRLPGAGTAGLEAVLKQAGVDEASRDLAQPFADFRGGQQDRLLGSDQMLQAHDAQHIDAGDAFGQ